MRDTVTLQDRAEQLTGFVQDRAGQHFLGTVTYTTDGHELVAVESANEAAYDQQTVSTLVDLLRGHHDVSVGTDYPGIPAGELQTAVYVLERAIVLHYMIGETDGVAIALSPDAGRNLFEFVTETSRFLKTSE